MKIQLIRDAEGPAGVVPAGTEIDDPLAWIHCLPGHLNSDPIAVPVDDECKAKVDAELAKRPEQLLVIKRMLKSPPKGMPSQFVEQLKAAYALDLDKLPPVAV